MAKYGLFDGMNEQPSQTFEGDTMQQNGEYVATTYVRFSRLWFRGHRL